MEWKTEPLDTVTTDYIKNICHGILTGAFYFQFFVHQDMKKYRQVCADLVALATTEMSTRIHSDAVHCVHRNT